MTITNSLTSIQVSVIIIFFNFWTTLGSFQCLLLTLYSGITASWLGGAYGMLVIVPQLAESKANTQCIAPKISVVSECLKKYSLKLELLKLIMYIFYVQFWQ